MILKPRDQNTRFPPALTGEQQAELKTADLNYPVSSTGRALNRLGFVLKRPKKRLLKADPARREAFVAEYVALTAAAHGNESKIFFADEAHFQADADPVSRYGAGSAGPSSLSEKRGWRVGKV